MVAPQQMNSNRCVTAVGRLMFSGAVRKKGGDCTTVEFMRDVVCVSHIAASRGGNDGGTFPILLERGPHRRGLGAGSSAADGS